MGTQLSVAVLQPSYLPWLGYLDQIAASDIFVFYDDVQFDKNGWRNRNRIRTARGEGWSWLTVPVTTQAHFPPINEVLADERVPWRRKHLRTLETEYARAPYRELLTSHFSTLFESTENNLAEIAIASIKPFMSALSISTPLHRSSQLGVTGDRNQRLLAICKHFGATHYLSGEAARFYLDVDLFAREGIRVEFQQYEHPRYKQLHEPFISHLSAIDALLNVGIRAREFLSR